MRLVLTVLLCVFTLGLQAQEIEWMTMNEALEAQKKNPKKIMVDVYTKWCGPCKLMDKNTFKKEEVAQFVNDNYYAVKFNAEGTETINYHGRIFENPDFDPKKRGRNYAHQFTTALKVRGYPTIVFFDDQGSLIQQIAGYRTPSQIEIYLKMIANDDYKTLTTKAAWEEYQQDFQGEFID